MDYLQSLEQLRKGDIEYFEISSEQFPTFQQVWQKYDYQQEIIGKAKVGGKIIYEKR